MSSLLSAELAATCNALGYFDVKSNKYYADSNTLETVKDLIRYLRRDDASHDIRRHLGETKVLQTDLLPLLKSYWEETDLFDVLLRLIVNLTTPALILWNEEIPTDKTTRNHYLQVEDHLQYYKEAFADEGVWAVLSTRLSKILEIDYTERGDENSLIIERILILIRNVLYVPADSMEKRPDNDASIHDQVLWALHQSGMLDIILYITSSAPEQAYYMHILEILSFMLREQKASELANAALQRSKTEKIRDEAELLAMRHRETSQKQKKAKIYSGTRHSRFGGTFVVKSMKSISDNELIYHKPLNKVDSLNFDTDKQKPKTPKNRLPIVGTSGERRSAFTIRLFLKEFCVEFLNGAYNTLMYHVKDNLVRAKAQAHDESYYLWAVRFFMEFNRCHKFEVALVSETMSVQTFHYVQQQSENFFDLMQIDKKKLRLWSRRLHLALLAYRELFLTLCAMDKCPDGTVRDSAKVIKSNIFYVPEYREFVLTLLVNYNELKMSDVYLNDLIETQHIFVKIFENFCGKEGFVLVQKKTKKKRKTNKKASAPEIPVEQNLDDRWDEAAPQLSSVLESGGEFITDEVPFDAASDVPIDDQKADAMKKVQRKLRNGEFEKAIGLLRAAREVWPENDSFGSNNMASEEEFIAMREIFLADLGENNPVPASQPVEDDSDDEEDEEETNAPSYDETDMNFDDFIKRLAHPKIVRACGLALSQYEKNSVNTNHCIVKLLHRIAFDCKMYVMVFQVSIFRTFQKIFLAKDFPQYKELVKFATYIIRQFFKVAESNNKLFMEAIFWKSKKDAYDIELGYGSFNEQSSAGAKVWSEEEEDELRKLFMEHQENQIQEDIVDWIVKNLIDHTKTRRLVLKKLRELYLLDSGYKFKKSGNAVTGKAPQNWGAQEETQLQELYEEFKEAMDPLGCIMSRLEINRPKNRVIEKMLVMGLIQDKKELRKKRAKSGRSGPSKKFTSGSDDDRSSEFDSDTSDHVQSTIRPNAAVKTKLAKTRVSSKKSTTKKKAPSTKASRPQLTKHLLAAMAEGQQEALEWLKESLSDAIEDFDDENDEGIPLVPIMDYAQAAMENDEFKQMLKAFGICEPFDEQEVYWRIPGHLTIATLKEYSDLIQQALDQTLTMDNVNTEDNENIESTDDIFDTLSKQPKQNVLEEKSDNESSDDDYLEQLKRKRVLKSVDTKKGGSEVHNVANDPQSVYVNEEGDTTEIISNVMIENNDEEDDTEMNNTSFNKRSRNIIESESEEENDKVDAVTPNESKRNRSGSDSDSNKPITKRSRLIESDDDE